MPDVVLGVGGTRIWRATIVDAADDLASAGSILSICSFDSGFEMGVTGVTLSITSSVRGNLFRSGNAGTNESISPSERTAIAKM